MAVAASLSPIFLFMTCLASVLSITFDLFLDDLLFFFVVVSIVPPLMVCSDDGRKDLTSWTDCWMLYFDDDAIDKIAKNENDLISVSRLMALLLEFNFTMTFGEEVDLDHLICLTSCYEL